MNGPVDFAAVFDRLEKTGQAEETAALPGVNVRTVRIASGAEGRWHSHAHTAETVVVWRGDFTVAFRDHVLELSPGQCCVVPIGAEHCGTSREGAEVILFQQTA